MGYLYRCTDKADGIIKYIGIVHSETKSLYYRFHKHKEDEEWWRNTDWEIHYMYLPITRAELEAFETNYIAYYETFKWYNNSKGTWGINQYMPIHDENEWILYDKSIYVKEDSHYQDVKKKQLEQRKQRELEMMQSDIGRATLILRNYKKQNARFYTKEDKHKLAYELNFLDHNKRVLRRMTSINKCLTDLNCKYLLEQYDTTKNRKKYKHTWRIIDAPKKE